MRAKNIGGFTLIELLVALTIFSAVVVAIYSTFSVGIKARDKGEKASDLFQEGRLTLDGMATEIRNMVKYSSYQFVGGPDLVSFPTLLRKGDQLEIYYVTYYLEPNKKDRSMILKRKKETPFQGIEEMSVSSLAAEIKFDYGYKSAKGTSYQWSDSWDSSVEESYPLAIKIRLALGQDDGQEISFTKTVHIPINHVSDEGQL